MAKRRKNEDRRHSAPRTIGKAYFASAAVGTVVATGLAVGAHRRVGARNLTPGVLRGARTVGNVAGVAAGGGMAYRGYRKRKAVKAGTLKKRARRGGGRQRRDSEGKFH